MNHLFILDSRVYEARPAADVENDQGWPFEDKRIKWVIFHVYTRPGPDIVYDGAGYATSLKAAKRGDF